MQDEHFQRQWTAAHGQFADGVDQGIAKLAALLSANTSHGQPLLDRARLTTRAVVVGVVSGLAAGSVLFATATLAPPASANAIQTAIHIHAAPRTLA